MNSSSNSTLRADVIIIGGGFMGAATAFFLRQRGMSVILLERNLIGQAASGTNFGNVRRQGRYLPQLPLANLSRDLWGKLLELIGEDAEFLPSGHLRVAFNEHNAAKLVQYAQDAKAYQLDLEVLSGNTARDRFPMLSKDVHTVSYAPLDGHANPRLAAPAFGRAAKRAGAHVMENAEVTGIIKEHEDFVVETKNHCTYRAPLLQISAGAWAQAMAASFGDHLHLTARGPQMGVTEPVPYRIGPVLGVTSDIEEEIVYLRQVARGNIVIGGGRRNPADLLTQRAHPNPLSTLRQLPQLTRLLPDIAKLRIIRTWSGVEGYLDDNIPAIGPSPNVCGLFYAFGFSGHGFQLGPAVGYTMAELITTGQTTVPIDPFHIGRFARV